MKLSIRVLLISAIFCGLCPAKAQDISEYENILAEYFDQDGPGATAIVTQRGEVLYQGATGLANLELKVQMEPHHVFRLGSITKQFTAMAILMLKEDGKLSIDDPITSYLKNYPTHSHEISIRHLLTHTSGIQSYTDIPGFMESETRKDMTLEELIDVFKDQPINFSPGEEWKYNNSGYVLLGAIIEEVSGMSYAEFIQLRIFDVLGMTNSHYDNHNRIIEDRIPGYAPSDEGPQNADFLSMTIPYAAGSLLSNVEDLAKWNHGVHAGNLVSAATLHAAFEPYILADGSDSGYGYGWTLNKIGGSPSYEHGGGIHGFLTNGIYLPEEDVYVAVLSNCTCNPPANASIRMAALAIGHSLEFDNIDVNPAALEEYIGVYDIDDSEDTRQISVKDGVLYSKRGEGAMLSVSAYAEDKFYYENSFTTLEFVRDHEDIVIGQNVTPRSGLVGYAVKTDQELIERTTVELAAGILTKYVGDYQLMPGFVLTITQEGSQLIAQATGQESFPLMASSETEFFLEVVGAELEFVVNEDGTCTNLILKQGGQTLEGKRVD